MLVRVYGPDNATIFHLQTSATGADWVDMPSTSCRSVTVFNTTGTAIRVRRTAQDAPNWLTLPDGTSRSFGGIRNANQLAIQRDDQSNTQATVQCETEDI